jgi:hypothetical protein
MLEISNNDTCQKDTQQSVLTFSKMTLVFEIQQNERQQNAIQQNDSNRNAIQQNETGSVTFNRVAGECHSASHW